MSISVKYRVFVFIIICFLPTFLFNKGYSNGVQQLDLNAEGQYVIADGFCSSDDQAKYRFVSVIGGKFISISSSDESICVRSAENFRLVKYNQTDGDDLNTNKAAEVKTAS